MVMVFLWLIRFYGTLPHRRERLEEKVKRGVVVAVWIMGGVFNLMYRTKTTKCNGTMHDNLVKRRGHNINVCCCADLVKNKCTKWTVRLQASVLI